MSIPSTASPPRVSIRREVREVARLAAPIVTVQLGMLLMGTVDTMMLGRLSKEALAAGALGTAVTFGIAAPAFGLIMAVDPLVSQAHGAGDRAAVLRHLVRGLVVVGTLSLLTMLGLWFVGPQLHWLRQQPEIVPLSTEYLRGVVPGMPGFLLFFLVRQTLQSMSIVRPAVLAVVAGNLVNVVANYALVFGGFGAPALGVLGSGLATSISRWVLLLVLVAASWPLIRQVVPARSAARSSALSRALRPGAFVDLVRLGVPISLQQAAEYWIFSLVALMMGALGAVQFAGHQIALNLASLAFMVPLGVAGAAATRVGNAIGRRDVEAARRAAVVSLGLGAAAMSLSALTFAAFPRLLGRLYTPEPEVIAVAATLLPIAAAFQIVDGLQVVAAGVLRGAADTLLPAALALIGFWGLGLPAAWLLAFPLELGPRGLWWGLTLGLATTAVLLVLRTRRRLSQPVEALLAERRA
ncbi:MAG: MATE family efflux transporter [Acidobacteria bacterium]|nr:MAG: MATE family efflux transporter [Acidobacteriota bacterium]REK06905.1 MAG: MATE family efflux transporter [Acidobacteriota bacterium]